MVIERPDSRATIAHYRKVKVWFSTAAMALVFMLAPYITFWAYGGHAISDAINSRRIDLIFFLVTMWILAPVILFVIAARLRQLIFDSGRAVWIDKGLLIVLHRRLFSVPCDAIVSISYGTAKISTFVEKPGVVLNLRNDNQRVFTTGGLSEPRDVIIARLNAALNLVPSPNFAKEDVALSTQRFGRS